MINIILAILLKSAFLLPKNSMCPILLKAIHAQQGGLMPASVYVFGAGWVARVG